MNCYNPITLRNPAKIMQENDNRSWAEIDSLPDSITVPCGTCFACLSKRREEWQFRLQQEQRVSTSSYFITLTYSENNLTYAENYKMMQPCVSKSDVQKFMKRLRRMCEPDKLRYFLVSEYGSELNRPHYHMLLFNFPDYRLNVNLTVLKAWNLGMIDIGTVTPQSISYCAKYCLAYADQEDWIVKPFMLCSRNPGIGASYLSENVVSYHKNKLEPTVRNLSGIRQKMPRYYRNKLDFTSLEKDIINDKSKKFREELEKEFRNKHGDSAEQILNQQIEMDKYTKRKLLKKSKL